MRVEIPRNPDVDVPRKLTHEDCEQIQRSLFDWVPETLSLVADAVYLHVLTVYRSIVEEKYCGSFQQLELAAVLKPVVRYYSDEVLKMVEREIVRCHCAAANVSGANAIMIGLLERQMD